MVIASPSGTNGASPASLDNFKTISLGGKDEAARYIIDAAAMVREVKGQLHPIVVAAFVQSVSQ